MQNNHKSVVRNQGYTRAVVSHIERHNERKNGNYGNLDVIKEQSQNNIYFKFCECTYLAKFDKMVENGEISTRGLKLTNTGTKPESNIVAEMIFDVNTEYFDEQYKNHGFHSSYDFACAYYTEAYKMAVKEVGDEKYVLSAILHADERNKGLSEKLGRDVYHYHLHVTYIPVVQKEIKWTKRAKPELVGKIKEVVNQVNHSKKWESEKIIDDNGKEQLIYSYSLLQDRYHDYMKEAGFIGFDRGKEGSTAQHLSVTEYKIQKRNEELAEKESELEAVNGDLTKAKSELVTIQTKSSQTIDKYEGKRNELKSEITTLESQKRKLDKLAPQLKTLTGIEKIPIKQGHTITKQNDGSRETVTISKGDWEKIKATAIRGARNKELEKSLDERERQVNAVAHGARKIVSDFSSELDGRKNYHKNRYENAEAYRIENIEHEYSSKIYSIKKWLDEQPKPKKKNEVVI